MLKKCRWISGSQASDETPLQVVLQADSQQDSGLNSEKAFLQRLNSLGACGSLVNEPNQTRTSRGAGEYHGPGTASLKYKWFQWSFEKSWIALLRYILSFLLLIIMTIIPGLLP